MSSKNVINNRKVLISNLPNGVTSNEIIQELFKSQNFKFSSIDFDGSSAIVTLANASEAKRAAKLINGQLFKGLRISVIEAPPPETFTPSSGGSNFLVVGNLSFDFTEEQFKNLMSPHGEIKNAFLVRGKTSKKSKGYGFIEYKYKESANKAKDHFIKTDAKFVDGRIIRVETVPSSLTTGEAKHSRSLFVDKLPKSFEDDEQLKNLFSSVGNVTFCKVARNRQRQPRGYALIDYASVIDAEKGQEKLDGTQIGESSIRISFCTPGKTAQDICSKFDDTNNRKSGGGQGMAGSHGPRMQTLMAGNAGPLPGGFMARPEFPQPGPLRTPFSIGTLPGMQRPPIPTLRPRMPLLVPNPIRVPVPFSGPALRIPRIRAPDVRTMHPGIKPGQGVRKIRPKNNVVTLKSRTNASKSSPGKGNEKADKVSEEVNKMVDEAKQEAKTSNQNVQANDQKAAKEKPPVKETANQSAKGKQKAKASSTEPVVANQKLSESTAAPATSQPSEDEGKVLQPVVFMDSEQLKQFQQFQELMKKQKEAEKSGDSTAVSLEDLVAAAKGMKEAEGQKPLEQTTKSEAGKPSVEPKQPQASQKTVKQGAAVSKKTPQMSEESKSAATKSSSVESKSSPAQAKPLPASTKSSTVSGKPSSTAAKPSPKPLPSDTKASSAATKPSPAASKPSSVPTKPSPAMIKPASIKLSPAIANSSSIPARHSSEVSKSSTAWKSPATSKPSSTPEVSKSNTAWKSPATSKQSSTPEVSKSSTAWKSPATSKPSSTPEVSKSNTVWKSPGTSKQSYTPEVSKSNTAWKSPATSKPSFAPSRSTQPKQDAQMPAQRQERSTASSHNSYQRPSQHHQKPREEEPRSGKSAGSYERERKQNDRNSYHDSKPVNTTSRSGSSSSTPMQPPPKPPLAANILQKLFGTKLPNKQDFGSDQRTNSNQNDSRSPYGNSYQGGGKSSPSVSEAPRGSPKSSQQSQYAYNQQYQSTDGRNYESKRSPAPERESPAAQNSLRSRYTLPERLPHARGDGEPVHASSPRYERQQERELISYPRPRADFPPRNDPPPSVRDINPPYGSPQSRGQIEPRDSPRDMRSGREPIGTRSLASLRDLLPPRVDSPGSRDPLLARDRSPRDYLQRDLPPRDVSPRSMPPRDAPPRDMPKQRDSFPPRDFQPRDMLPPRDVSPRDMLPPRDVSPRDMLPPRGLPARDDRSGRRPYMNEMENPRDREPMHYNDSPSRYQSSTPSREALDRARFERAITGGRDGRSDYPAYGREPEPRYGRELPSRESAMGTVRGPPTRYPLEGPQNKRPRY